MATSTIFTNITIKRSDDVELFLDALEKSERASTDNSIKRIDYTEDPGAANKLIDKVLNANV